MNSLEKINPNIITLTVNNKQHEFEIGDKPNQVAPFHTLSQTLREKLGLVGTKIGCNRGSCGSCTILLDDKPILSCMTLTVECNNSRISTIEGLANQETGELDPLQQSFVDHTAFQCGFCTPGMIMASKSLLHENPAPDEHEVKDALAGHYCRCISHYHVVDAVLDAAPKRRSPK